jgi:lipoate-protein ligase B
VAESQRPALTVLQKGLVDYDDAFRLQQVLREECLASGGRRNYLVLLQHPPVITLGRSGDRSDVLASKEQLATLGVGLVETNRGGEVTYHGPGQLVGYPIIHLGRRGRDLHRYLRDLESWLVGVCRSCGVPAHADSEHTGVWVEERKIASIGIAVRRWVTYHGVALNVTTDLSRFGLIVPCGLQEVTMTSLEHEAGETPPVEEVAARAAAAFATHFGMSITPVPESRLTTA